MRHSFPMQTDVSPMFDPDAKPKKRQKMMSPGMVVPAGNQTPRTMTTERMVVRIMVLKAPILSA